LIRRTSYEPQKPFIGLTNSQNNTKYGYVNPINGMTNQNFNPKSTRRDTNPTTMMAATGIVSNDPTKYTKFDSKMGASAMNFTNDRQFRQTTTNEYAGIGVPVLKKTYTSDNFNSGKPYPMGRGSSQNASGARGTNDFNSYFRSSAQAMFGSQAIAMPKY
jgi:hypothetical protein